MTQTHLFRDHGPSPRVLFGAALVAVVVVGLSFAAAAALLAPASNFGASVRNAFGISPSVPLPPRHPLAMNNRLAIAKARYATLTAQDPVTGLPPLEAMIGQMLLVGFSGNAPEDPGVLETLEYLRRGDISGVIFFNRNVKSRDDVMQLTSAFKDAAAPAPPFIAIDQEGGKVQRLRQEVGFPETPEARLIAAEGLDDAQERYTRLANALAHWGFNMNLGPVVDLALEETNTVVVTVGRSYGTDPQLVADYGATFVDAHRDAGVVSALKHFPGHGSTLGDTHKSAINMGKTWSRKELEPFRLLIERGSADAVMIAHAALPLDGKATPASLSSEIINGLLREELGFDGIVISDDMAMAGVTDASQDPIVDAIRAGNDVLIVTGPTKDIEGSFVPSLQRRISAAAKEDPELRNRIIESYKRVQAFKEARLIADDTPQTARAD